MKWSKNFITNTSSLYNVFIIIDKLKINLFIFLLLK